MTKTAKAIRTTRVVSLDGLGPALDKCLALWARAQARVADIR